ncbi:MAG: hypothetical protein Q4C25_05815 [Bacillota bacterium]|nr:hypothetical protein [Bacillota bacterium]
MISKEAAIRRFVKNYEIEVPQPLVEEEYKFCVMNMKHQMRYAEMTGTAQMNPIEQMKAMKVMEEKLKEEAYYNVKEELVIKDVIHKQDFVVTREELEQHAREIAERQDSEMEMVKKFFGEDFKMLESDVKRQKAENWIYEQMSE